MKRVVLCVLCALCLMPAISFCTLAGDGDIDSYNEEFDVSGVLSGVDSDTASLLSDMGIDEITFESVFSVTPKKVFDLLFNLFTGSLKEPFKFLLTITGLLAIIALFKSFSESPENVSAVGACMCALIIAVPLANVLSEAFSVLSSLGVFTVSFSGVFCAVVSASGNPVTGASYGALSMSMGTAFSMLTESFSVPLSNALCTLGFLSCFNIYSFGENAAALVKKVYIYALGLLSTVFTGFLSVKGILAASADSVASRGVRFVVGRSVPVVGGAISESYASLLASLSMIKTTVGVFGIITVALTVLPVVITLSCWILSFNLSIMVSQAFGCPKVTSVLAIFKDVMVLLIASVSFLTMIFIISVGIVIYVKGGGV